MLIAIAVSAVEPSRVVAIDSQGSFAEVVMKEALGNKNRCKREGTGSR
jgi:hypothetical protein